MSSTQGVLVPDAKACETTNEIIMSANPVYGVRPTSKQFWESEMQVEENQYSDVHVYASIQ